MHNPQRVHLSFGSMKITLRFSPMVVGGEKNRFSKHTCTQSVHFIHKISSITIFFKEIHYKSVISYLFIILNLRQDKKNVNFIPTLYNFYLNV